MLKTVRNEGGSRVITVTQLIPKEWQYVEVEKVDETEDVVTIKIKKVK